MTLHVPVVDLGRDIALAGGADDEHRASAAMLVDRQQAMGERHKCEQEDRGHRPPRMAARRAAAAASARRWESLFDSRLHGERGFPGEAVGSSCASDATFKIFIRSARSMIASRRLSGGDHASWTRASAPALTRLRVTASPRSA